MVADWDLINEFDEWYDGAEDSLADDFCAVPEPYFSRRQREYMDSLLTRCKKAGLSWQCSVLERMLGID